MSVDQQGLQVNARVMETASAAVLSFGVAVSVLVTESSPHLISGGRTLLAPNTALHPARNPGQSRTVSDRARLVPSVVRDHCHASVRLAPSVVRDS